MSTELADCYGPDEWVSECCGARGYLDLHIEGDGKTATGICSDCHEHATFVKEEEED